MWTRPDNGGTCENARQFLRDYTAQQAKRKPSSYVTLRPVFNSYCERGNVPSEFHTRWGISYPAHYEQLKADDLVVIVLRLRIQLYH
jgi:hypothetical protein